MPTQAIAPLRETDFAAEVRVGLSLGGQKELPSKYFYDEIGSALFEVICALPEYGLCRAGARLLEHHAENMVERLHAPTIVAELGSGSGKKTRYLLEALSKKQQTTYYPIDISASALVQCARELSHIDSVSVVGFEQAYLQGLIEVTARRRPHDQLLVLFLGSTIGNFDRPAGDEFLRQVREILRPRDCLLLATDLMKPVPQLLRAYDDAIGATRAFNLNLLARINRELGADFDLTHFSMLRGGTKPSDGSKCTCGRLKIRKSLSPAQASAFVSGPARRFGRKAHTSTHSRRSARWRRGRDTAAMHNGQTGSGRLRKASTRPCDDPFGRMPPYL